MADRTCTGCGDPISPAARGDRNPRKWCTQSCRTWGYAHPGELRVWMRTGRTCDRCGVSIDHRLPAARFCSDVCSSWARRGTPAFTSLICSECQASFIPKNRLQLRCSTACGRKVKVRIASQRRRALKRGVGSERFSSVEVFDRDGWRCGLCQKRVDRRLAWPHPMSASLDHLVPLSEGGDHTRANTQLAHLFCNQSKHTSAQGEQLRLIG